MDLYSLGELATVLSEVIPRYLLPWKPSRFTTRKTEGGIRDNIRWNSPEMAGWLLVSNFIMLRTSTVDLSYKI